VKKKEETQVNSSIKASVSTNVKEERGINSSTKALINKKIKGTVSKE
jgi:hypothetical protein